MWGVTYVLLTIAVTLWMIWRKRHFSLLKELGIPGPEPNVIFGNFWEMSSKTPLVCQKEWANKYGKVFGYYMGMKPVVVVADLDLVKKINISDFHKFMNRPVLFGIRKKLDENDGYSYQLLRLRGQRWKEIRRILTPSFTTKRLRLMVPMINEAIDTLIAKIEEKSKTGETFDINDYFQELTLDIIGRTALGIHTDCQRNPDDPVLKSARAVMGGNIRSWTMLLAFSFPELNLLWEYVAKTRMMRRNNGIDPVQQLLDSVKFVVNERKKDPTKRRNDLLQILMDAQMSDLEMTRCENKDLTAGDEDQEDDQEIKETNENTQISPRKFHSLLDVEVIHNAVLFLMAGFDTSRVNLSFTTHFLLHYPEVQDKVREEIDTLIEREGIIDYSSVQNLKYTKQVLQESLRVYPPVHLFVNRETGEDVQYENLRLRKGLTIQIPTYLIHRHEDYWTDPDKFDPDRFAPENKDQVKSLAFQPFGVGPRNCVGIRYAQMVNTLILARILHRFKLIPCAETEKLDIELKVAAGMIQPLNGIKLKAEPIK